MTLGGKSRPMERAAPRTPEASAQSGARLDDAARAQVGAEIRAHVRQVLQQAGSRASAERD